MGGLFGLYVLFHQPETFQRYIIGSPACLLYDIPPFLKYEAEYASKHRELSAIVFMSFGALEETQGTVKIPTGIRDMQSLTEMLRKRNYSGLKLETKIFEGETHLSGWPLTITRGLRDIYRK
jgi:predicted alpha/beta superfamily hydrolase